MNTESGDCMSLCVCVKELQRVRPRSNQVRMHIGDSEQQHNRIGFFGLWSINVLAAVAHNS